MFIQKTVKRITRIPPPRVNNIKHFNAVSSYIFKLKRETFLLKLIHTIIFVAFFIHLLRIINSLQMQEYLMAAKLFS